MCHMVDAPVVLLLAAAAWGRGAVVMVAAARDRAVVAVPGLGPTEGSRKAWAPPPIDAAAATAAAAAIRAPAALRSDGRRRGMVVVVLPEAVGCGVGCVSKCVYVMCESSSHHSSATGVTGSDKSMP